MIIWGGPHSPLCGIAGRGTNLPHRGLRGPPEVGLGVLVAMPESIGPQRRLSGGISSFYWVAWLNASAAGSTPLLGGAGAAAPRG